MNASTSDNLKLKNTLFIVAVIATLIAAFGLYKGLSTGESRYIVSWLFGFTVWYSVSLGMLFITMILNVFDSGWGVIVRRQVEHLVGFFPFLAIIFLPLVLIAWFYHNPGILWEWMNPNLVLPGSTMTVANDPLYINKSALLNVPFFTFRVVFYFGLFSFIASKLRNWSYAMDTDANLKYYHYKKILSSVGIPAVALTCTFATVDFFMSLSYHWYSTIYGVWFFATSMRAALAVLVIVLAILSTKGYLKGILNNSHLYLLGCMFLAFTIFWAYISFCQYFLIYSANIPEETYWFNIRELAASGEKSSWWWISLFGLILGYFFIPFFVLLFYKTKVILSRMVFISCWILVFFLADLAFHIIPRKHEASNPVGFIMEQFAITPFDIAAIVGFGALFFWSFLNSIKKSEHIPVHDPRIQESLHTHH